MCSFPVSAADEEEEDDDDFSDDAWAMGNVTTPPGYGRKSSSGTGGHGGMASAKVAGPGVFMGIAYGRNGKNAAAEASTQWLPMHMVTHWEDRNHREHITVAVSIPSGVSYGGLNGKVKLDVSPDCKHLMVQCEWPTTLFDTEYLEEGWKDESEFNERDLIPMVKAWEKETERIRETLDIQPHVPIYSTATIKLHIEVEKELTKVTPFFDRKRGGQILFVVLRVRKEKTQAKINLDFKVHDWGTTKTDGSTRAPTKITTNTKRRKSADDHFVYN